MRQTSASIALRRGGIAALICGVGMLSACTSISDLKSPKSLYKPKPLAISEIPTVDWSETQEVRMLATEYAFSPNDPVFKAGTPYRLLIRNVGDSAHVLKGSHFLKAIAIHEVKLTEFTTHGFDGHADKAIGPDNADGVPEIPDIKEGARDLVGENNADAIAQAANSGAAGGPKEAANPFAAAPAEEEEEADDDESGANPFAAKAGDEEQEAAEEGANPFAAKPDADEEADEDETAEADTDDATGDSTDEIDDKSKSPDEDNVAAKVEDEDGDAEDDDDISASKKAPVEEVDDDDSIIAKVSEPAKPVETTVIASKIETAEIKPADKKMIDWEPVTLNRIAIPVGHEVSIEFVAVRPGTYRILSADIKYAMTGMYGAATIE
ncbi:MAG: hypothetical protein HN725_20910 [Alphaproteobacteria bacterium]|nr:hypothetical protein [Alphaproteobacteria bacterium]MBT4083178.1 hypothetical protein [Alphaproteobacteria bacterium]MBT4546244.1 hypothetical protein [Alphaproteobacteria bacterium]MBT6384233.1 hypothetical protein [Alphaproteobacteria bacterium]MBT7747762.1 hypothetical protein [Alphaproteobacteria bacterium]